MQHKIKKTICLSLLICGLFAVTLKNLKAGDVQEVKVSTFAGGKKGFSDGKGGKAKFNNPTDIIIDESGNLYVVDSGNRAIRKITPDGNVTTIIRDEKGEKFSEPISLALYKDSLFVTDISLNCIKEIRLSNPVIQTFAGVCGKHNSLINYFSYRRSLLVKFRFPVDVVETYLNLGMQRLPDEIWGHGLAILENYPKIYPEGVSSEEDRKRLEELKQEFKLGISTKVEEIEHFADGKSDMAKFHNPWGIAITPDGSVWITDISNQRIRKVDKDPSGETFVTTVAGNKASYYDLKKNSFFGGYVDGIGDKALFNFPLDICYGNDGFLYIVDRANGAIRRLDINTSTVETLVKLDVTPNGITYSNKNNMLYVTTDAMIIEIDISTKKAQIIAGKGIHGMRDGKGKDAQFASPYGIAVDKDGNIYVADSKNDRIRKIVIGK